MYITYIHAIQVNLFLRNTIQILEVDMKGITSVFLAICLLMVVGCGGGGGGGDPTTPPPPPPPPPDPQKASWNVMIYFGGDNNLAPMALIDLQELEQVGSTSQVHFTVLADIYFEVELEGGGVGVFGLFNNSDQLVTPMMRITKNPQEGIQSHLVDPEAVLYDNIGYNSADPQNLTNFIKWSAQKYPADKYALILWDHGGSWLPGRASAGAIQDMWEGEGNSMYIHEIDAAIKNSGVHFNLLDFDACNMASIEVLYQLKDVSDYICVSQRTIPGSGNEYTGIANFLVSNPSATGKGLGGAIIDTYIAFSTPGDEASLTRSLIETSKLGAVASAVNQVVPYLADPAIISSEALELTFNEPVRFFQDVDIVNYANVLQYHSNNPNLSNNLENLKTAVYNSVVYNRVFSSGTHIPDLPFPDYEYHPDQDFNVAWASGLSIFLPRDWDWIEWNFGYYTSIGWDLDTGWSWVIRHAFEGRPFLEKISAGWWAQLEWDSDADLDFWIFEPSGAGDLVPVAPCIAPYGLNGFLSDDSFFSGISAEAYFTFEEVIHGPYYFIADFYSSGSSYNNAYCHLVLGNAEEYPIPAIISDTYYITATTPNDPDFGPGMVYFGFLLYDHDDHIWYFYEGDRTGVSYNPIPTSDIRPDLEYACPTSEEIKIRRPSGNFDPELIESYHLQGMQLADEMSQYTINK